MANGRKKVFGKSMSFRVCVYRAEFDPKYFTAHCLELDVIGQGRTLQDAVDQLLEAIETQLKVCAETGAQFELWAPPIVWYRYEQARKANRKISDELIAQIVQHANERLGHESQVNIDCIAGTKAIEKVIQGWPAVMA